MTIPWETPGPAGESAATILTGNAWYGDGNGDGP